MSPFGQIRIIETRNLTIVILTMVLKGFLANQIPGLRLEHAYSW